MTTWPQIPIDISKEFSMCFACGKENPIGLKLNFKWDGKTAKAEFTPSKFHQGWSGVVHGGIIECLLDEAMSYATYFQGTSCLTAKMQARLRRPALIDEPLIITSSISKKTRKLVETKASIALNDGTPIAEGNATMFVINPKQKDTSHKEERFKSNVQKQD